MMTKKSTLKPALYAFIFTGHRGLKDDLELAGIRTDKKSLLIIKNGTPSGKLLKHFIRNHVGTQH